MDSSKSALLNGFWLLCDVCSLVFTQEIWIRLFVETITYPSFILKPSWEICKSLKTMICRDLLSLDSSITNRPFQIAQISLLTLQGSLIHLIFPDERIYTSLRFKHVLNGKHDSSLLFKRSICRCPSFGFLCSSSSRLSYGFYGLHRRHSRWYASSWPHLECSSTSKVCISFGWKAYERRSENKDESVLRLHGSSWIFWRATSPRLATPISLWEKTWPRGSSYQKAVSRWGLAATLPD